MPNDTESFRRIIRYNIQFAIRIQNGSQILNFSIYLTGTGHSCETFADILRNFINTFAFCVFLYASIFQYNFHLAPLSFLTTNLFSFAPKAYYIIETKISSDRITVSKDFRK